MKQFRLKVVPIAGDPDGRLLNYREQLLALVRVFPEGISIAEMGDAINVARKLRAAGDVDKVLLENAEHAYLVARLAANRFTIAAEEIVAMSQELSGAPDVAAPHIINASKKRA